MPTRPASGTDRNALRNPGHANHATSPPATKIRNGSTGAGNGPATPGAKPPAAAMATRRETQVAAITNKMILVAGRITADPISTVRSTAQIAPNTNAPTTSNIKPPSVSGH